MGYTSTRPQVMEYFSRHVGEHVFRNDLVKGTKLTEEQVLSAVNNIRAAHERKEIDFPVEIVQRGQIWCYRPNKPEASTTKKMFEEIGTTKRNTIILQDLDGNLYEATEL